MTVTVPNEDQRVKPQENTKQGGSTRVFVVLNPVAGTTDATNARDTIERYCQEHGWQCNIHETKPDEDLRKLVREELKKGVDMVIAAGGDGTVAAVVSGMVNSSIPMGIVPAGTGNNLARDLAIPVDLSGSLNVLGGDHAIQEMDIMEVNGDYYVLNVSIGISSLVMRKTGREEKRKFGFLAYLYNLFGSIPHTHMHRFQVKVDGKLHRFSASELMIANCKLMGFQPQFEGVEVDPNDGRMDMFVVRTKSLGGYLDVLSAFILSRSRDADRNLRYLPAQKSIHIQSEFPLPVQADGEEIGVTPVEIKLVPKGLRIVVPQLL